MSDKSCHRAESVLCDIWSAMFGAEVGPHDDFFDLGGDSLRSIDVVIAARKAGLVIRSSAVLRNPTPARLAEALTLGRDRPAGGAETEVPAALVSGRAWPELAGPAQQHLVPITISGSLEPLFVLHSGDHAEAEREAVRAWGLGRPAHGFPAPVSVPPRSTVRELADRYIGELLGAQSEGPYYLAGFGQGAVIAYELARILRGRSHKVARLVMVGPPAVGGAEDEDENGMLRDRLRYLAARFGLIGNEPPAEILARMRQDGWYDGTVEPADLPRLQAAWTRIAITLRQYEPGAYDGPMILFQEGGDAAAAGPDWSAVATDLQLYWSDYGVTSLCPLISDTQLADVVRREFGP